MHASAKDTPHAITIPMQLELDRPYIDVTLVGADGKETYAHAWVDTGGGGILLTAGLAKRLGLKPVGAVFLEEGESLAPVDMPALRIGGSLIDLADAHALMVTGAPHGLSNTDAEMALPARMLRNYVVAFDYPAHTFALARPGGLQPVGTPVDASFAPNGMPVVRLKVAGTTQGFLLDTGGQFCMISIASLREWMKQQPSWKHVAGAYGPANMLIPRENQLEMLRIGQMQWGPFRIENAGAVSRRVGAYEKWMSGMLQQPIIGSIGGNVLRDFRVTIDYPGNKIYLRRQPVLHSAALDTVGVTLGKPGGDGYTIVGTASDVHDIQVGDQLLQVDGHDTATWPYSDVAGWLAGQPGQTHRLSLLRAGKAITVEAGVRSVF